MLRSPRPFAAGDVADLLVETLDELLDQGGGRGRLLELDPGQGALVVLVGEVRRGEAAREQGGHDERSEDRNVFPGQAPSEPAHSNFTGGSSTDRLPIDPVCEDDRRLRDMDPEPPGSREVERELDLAAPPGRAERMALFP